MAMALRTLEDAYVNALLTLLVSLIPLFTIGFLGFDAVLNISVCVGAVTLIACIARMINCISRHRIDESTPVMQTMVSYYCLPYAFLLSYLILEVKGISIQYVLWFSVALFLIVTPIAVRNLIGSKEK